MTEPDRVVFVVDDDASTPGVAEGPHWSVGLRVEAFASAQEFLQASVRTRPLAWCSMCA